MRRWSRRLAVLAALLALRALQVASCATAEDADHRLAYLERRLISERTAGVAPGPPFDGEWALGSLSMTAAAATNLAFADPSTRVDRLRVVEALVDRALEPRVRAFDTAQWRADALESLAGRDGHIGYLGHLDFMLGAECLLGGQRHRALHDEVSAALARRMAASIDSQLNTYPGQTYLMDNAVVAAALALHDQCREALTFEPMYRRWVEQVRERYLDPATGLVRFAPGQPSRGSGAGWLSFYLPFVDEVFAAQQWRQLKAHLLVELPLGASAVLESSDGAGGAGDVDSGPLVFGLSPSGTGFALAGAARAGDLELSHRLLVTAETVGLSVGSSQRCYVLAPLVGDAIVLAMKTARAWRPRSCGMLRGHEASGGSQLGAVGVRGLPDQHPHSRQ